MRLFLVRHYKTLGNISNQIIGWSESPPADNWQADLAFVIQQLNKTNIRFDCVCTSNLERARNTGKAYAQALSVNSESHATALNEVDYGDLSKKNKQWVEKHVPQHKIDAAFVYPGGESFLQMQRRSVKHIETLAEKQGKTNILVVAHAGVIRGLVCHFLQLDYAANLKRKIGHRYIGDFTFEKHQCRSYQERGVPSGFVADKVIKSPWRK
jgi:alpha-ribazole phosphatase